MPSRSSRHDARPDRQRRGRRPEVRRRRPVPLRPARRHRQRRRRRSKRWPTRSPRNGLEGRLVRRAGLAADRRRLAMGDEDDASNSSTQVQQGLPHRPADARASASARTASSASTPRPASRTGTRIPRATPRRSPRPSARPAEVARTTANDSPPKAKSAGAACTPGARWSNLLELVDMPGVVGFQADMAHTLLYMLGYNAEKDRILPEGLRLEGHGRRSTPPTRSSTDALRPWTIDFHVAQNDGTVFGSGTHDKTGRHCQADRPERQARHRQTRRLLAPRRQGQAHQDDPPHLLGRLHVPQRRDGKPQTWNDILGAMIEVRERPRLDGR